MRFFKFHCSYQTNSEVSGSKDTVAVRATKFCLASAVLVCHLATAFSCQKYQLVCLLHIISAFFVLGYSAWVYMYVSFACGMSWLMTIKPHIRRMKMHTMHTMHMHMHPYTLSSIRFSFCYNLQAGCHNKNREYLFVAIVSYRKHILCRYFSHI